MPRRVLVAEDENTIRRILAEYLRGEGFEVELAPNGLDALRLARQTPPDVLVLDRMMPLMDAEGMLAAWLEDAALKDIPVVLISAAPDLSEIAKLFGVRATLAKPFDLDVLRAIIEQVLAHPETPPDVPTVPAN
jgi:DNA-binding response OmpR family regulator